MPLQESTFAQGRQSGSPRLLAFTGVVAAALTMTVTGCASTTPLKRPSESLVKGEPSWPDEVTRVAERVDRRCGAREAQLLYDYHEAKEEQQRFKTIVGSITGAVGTAGGAISGVGAYAIKTPETAKTVSGVSGIVTGGLGAIGTVITVVVSPGAAKMASATEALHTIEEKRATARAALEGKDPGAWSSDQKEAWAKAAKDLEAACK